MDYKNGFTPEFNSGIAYTQLIHNLREAAGQMLIVQNYEGMYYILTVYHVNLLAHMDHKDVKINHADLDEIKKSVDRIAYDQALSPSVRKAFINRLLRWYQTLTKYTHQCGFVPVKKEGFGSSWDV